MTNSPPRLLWTVSEVCAALQISRRTLYSISAPRGDLPTVRFGPKKSRVGYRPADVDNWIARHLQTTEAE